MIPHLPRCQGLAVVYYGFALGRLEAGAPSTFAQLGFKNIIDLTDFYAFDNLLYNIVYINSLRFTSDIQHNAMP